MIYYRARKGNTHRSVASVRALAWGAMLFYPSGALLVGLSDRSLLTSLTGWLLIVLAFACLSLVTNTTLQRIVGEEADKLDESELRLRGRAMTLAYFIFTGLILVGIIYAAIASDRGGWVPTGNEAYNGIFWGVIVYASVLPVAVPTSTVDSSFDDDGAQAGSGNA